MTNSSTSVVMTRKMIIVLPNDRSRMSANPLTSRLETELPPTTRIATRNTAITPKTTYTDI
ncbi:hypothetical protein D3C83_194960 [compost metagenome]